MATGMLQRRREFAGILPVVSLLLCITNWNPSANGDDDGFGGLSSLPTPSIKGFRKKITLPSLCSFEDVTALLGFRSQLSDPQNALSSWNPTTDCCTWRGITCSTASGQHRVTGLHLVPRGYESETSFLSVSQQFNGVAGVPLADLSALETLSLTSVTFNTNLPTVWGTLSNLSSLSLVNCAFKAEIPLTFAELGNLKHLCLSGNHLTGGLPTYMIRIFRQLQSLDLSSNSFTGGINQLFMLCSTLTSLDLGHNEFDNSPIPNLFGFMPGLRHLDLSHNRFGGLIPPSLQLLRHLRFLDLSSNMLDGSIPSVIFAIESLTTLFLHDNQLSGFPAQFPITGSRMEELDLSNNSLTGSIPPAISALRRIQSLDLSGNNLTGGIPGTLGLNSELEFLFLEKNGLVGPIPPEMASLHNLVLADVSQNFLLGPVPGGPWPSFPASSFEGNLALCGAPLNRCPVTI
ncbi:unnamed protein product [Calypogeia fissa]